MPRSPVYPAHRRGALLTSPSAFRLHRTCDPRGFTYPGVPLPGFSVCLICVPHRNSISFQMLADSFSLLPLFSALAPFVFNRLRTLSAKQRGWGCPTRSESSGRPVPMAFSRRIPLAVFRTGEPTSPRCRRKGLRRALEAFRPLGKTDPDSLRHWASGAEQWLRPTRVQ